MEKTINDFIHELQSLKPSLRELPAKIQAPNGIMFEPVIKTIRGEFDSLLEDPKGVIITY